MARVKPKTKKAKAAKVKKVLGEFKKGKLKDPSGKVIKKRKRAVAVALSEAGLTKKRKKK